METVLAGLQWDICLIYIDDVIVYGRTFEEALKNLETVLERLRIAGLRLKAQKCELFNKSVSFLGHIISDKGIKTDPEKIRAVKEWPVPVSVTEVRSFLGLCSYYRHFIPKFAEMAKPLHRLTEKGQNFIWSADCEEAFETLKKHLTESPVLAYPDFSKPFILDTDASDASIGAILSQVHDGKERVVCYGSRSLTKSERKYCVTRKELLSLVFFVKHYRHYLLGRKFKIRTDHNSLRWLMKTKNPKGQVARWIDALSSYQFDVEHRPGKKHFNADAMSRIPCKQCGRAENKISVRPVMMQVTEDLDFLQKGQSDDKDISIVRTWLDKGERPAWKEVNKYGAGTKTYWSQFDRLCVKNGLVCRQWLEKGKLTKVQVIVPKGLKSKILKYCHDEKTGGHFGVQKTLAKVRNGYYWAGLQRDVRNWVKSCETCCKIKPPQRTKRSPMQLVGAGHPMERVATDILGPLPETENGNKYILVISDYFTKWVEAVAIPDQTAITVARALVEEVVCRFGTPAYVHSDQGRQFEGTVYQEMCKLLGIKKTRTTPYHPESDGMVERYNKTLAKLISSFVNEEHTNWDQLLPYVMMAYRSSEHETTGFTPNYMMLGREVSVPIDIQFGSPVERTFASDWVNKLRERMEWAHDLARTNIETAMLRQKRYLDSKLFWESFEPGDKVFVFFPSTQPSRCRKFRGLWRGPCTVKSKLSDLTYSIKVGSGRTEYLAHIDNIKGYETRLDELVENVPEGGEHERGAEIEIEVYDTAGEDSEPWQDDAIIELCRGQRARRMPQRFSDYII